MRRRISVFNVSLLSHTLHSSSLLELRIAAGKVSFSYIILHLNGSVSCLKSVYEKSLDLEFQDSAKFLLLQLGKRHREDTSIVY